VETPYQNNVKLGNAEGWGKHFLATLTLTRLPNSSVPFQRLNPANIQSHRELKSITAGCSFWVAVGDTDF